MVRQVTCIRFVRSSKPSVFITLAAALIMAAQSCSFGDEPVVNVADLQTPVARLAAAKKSAATDSSIENRIRETTWRLLAGEAAAQPENGITSGACDALTQGLEELDSLLDSLQKDPDLERRVSKDAGLAIRLDVTKSRLTRLASVLELTRADELQRLSQLRQLNKAYRSLIQHLLTEQTELLVGHAEEALAGGEKAADEFEALDALVTQRRDFYLFDDEPKIDGNETDLKLAREIAAPYSSDVRRHHRALLSLVLHGLAVQKTPADEKLLAAAEQQAAAALKDSEQPEPIALYASGLVSLELGMLATLKQPFSAQAHATAAPMFASATKAFEETQRRIPTHGQDSPMATALNRLIRESSGPEVFLDDAATMQWEGRSEDATKYLQRGVGRHRDAKLAITLLETQWRQKTLQFIDLQNSLTSLLNEGLFEEANSDLLSGRSRILIGQAWRVLMDSGDSPLTENVRDAVSQQLNAGLADCQTLAKQDDVSVSQKWNSAALESLAVATLMVLAPEKNPAAASETLQRIPLIAMELEKLIETAKPFEKTQLFESLQSARLAEGYLAARLLPDYSDRTAAAFAAAANAGSRAGETGGRPLGSAVMRAMLARDDSASDRLLQEERQLRIAIQKMIPALATIEFSEPNSVSRSLASAYFDVASMEIGWNPQLKLDPRDTAGARDGIQRDMRAATVLALVRAGQAEQALQLVVSSLVSNRNVSALTVTDWNEIVVQSSRLLDPPDLFAFGKATEAFAIASLPADSDLRAAMLKNAGEAYNRGSNLLSQMTAWRERWPYLGDALGKSFRDLSSPEAASREAESLRIQMQMQEARRVLKHALELHPGSGTLRDQLVQILLDEAEIAPSRCEELLDQAKQQLLSSGTYAADTPTGTLLTLGQLQERLGDLNAAADAYQLVTTRSQDRAEQLKARSRLAVLRTRLTADP